MSLEIPSTDLSGLRAGEDPNAQLGQTCSKTGFNGRGHEQDSKSRKQYKGSVPNGISPRHNPGRIVKQAGKLVHR